VAAGAGRFLGLSVLQLPFPLIILSAALAGLLANRRWPALFATAKGSHGKAAVHFGPALIDDDTPTPAHARFSRSGLLRVVLAGCLLWFAPMLLLYSLLGWQHPSPRWAGFLPRQPC
jgi:chromate transporter